MNFIFEFWIMVVGIDFGKTIADARCRNLKMETIMLYDEHM